ncbi:hypothetical protein [Tepidibacter aestuarii]|uniref:hypothetical protein n=1 Tax=Tepidibacter aestuarii TaxID=2925782 RepID=UPI0020BF3728|nr:hypothetical protein [Tepidibacter aestuarii]
MEKNNPIKSIKENIQMAMELLKCRKCGCMKETLKTMKNEILKIKNNNFLEFLNELENSIQKMESIEYT